MSSFPEVRRKDWPEGAAAPRSQHLRPEQFAPVDHFAGHPEDPVSGVVQPSGCRGVRAARAFTTSKMKKLYFSTSASSCSRHSKWAWHSAIGGAPTASAFPAVRPKWANLSISAPVVLPMPTTMSVRAAVGRLITHSPLSRIMGKLWLALEMTHPTSAGVNSIIVCQPMVMMLVRPCQEDDTSTMGPGSR